MGKTVVVGSPAKVNLHIEVLGRREDGYHDIVSLFQMIELADEIRVSSLTRSDICVIEGNLDLPLSDSTVFKAVRAFREETGIRIGVRCHLTKLIPLGAGLGGGSSNAAFTLLALDRLFDTILPADRLAALGASIGSDVPFFLHGAAALVSGRGEIVEPLGPRTDFYLVIVHPGIHVSTADAYRWVDEERSGTAGSACGIGCPADRLVSAYRSLDPVQWPFFNSFFTVLTRRHPVLDETRISLIAAGAAYAGMTGSGSAMIGVFRSEAEAARAAGMLRTRYTFVWSGKPLAGLPVADYNKKYTPPRGREEKECLHGNHRYPDQEGHL